MQIRISTLFDFWLNDLVLKYFIDFWYVKVKDTDFRKLYRKMYQSNTHTLKCNKFSYVAHNNYYKKDITQFHNYLF